MIDEGIQLRRAGIKGDIIVMGAVIDASGMGKYLNILWTMSEQYTIIMSLMFGKA